jgi:2-C-methyl-D-erythritol 2,4-cyclodiphosphate synthase
VQFRVGLGHDIHRLAPGRRLVLGGVDIEFDKGPVGHSDADVLLHAVTDALLGAAGLGDIGQWFPDTDEKWKDADSADLLRTTVGEIRTRGWNIVNLDCTVSAERPKLTPYKPQIARRLAELLGTELEAVNVKAKTGEQVGPVGRGEAIAADAVVLLSRNI